MNRKTVLVSYALFAFAIVAAGLATFPKPGARPRADAVATCVSDVFDRISCRGLKGDFRNDCNRTRQLAITACIEERRATAPEILDRVPPTSAGVQRVDSSEVTLGRILGS